MNPITVISIGTGCEDLLTLAADRALRNAVQLVFRTDRCPVAQYLQREKVPFASLDELYERCGDFDEFNREAALRLIAMAEAGQVGYAVTDVAMDATVAELRRRAPQGMVTVLAGVSHADRCIAMLPSGSGGIRIIAASAFAGFRVTPEEALLLTELHSRELAGDCKLKLLELLPPELEIFLFSGDEAGRLHMRPAELCELDRQCAYDHLTAVMIPPVPYLRRDRFDMDDLVTVMKKLRAPGGCPWDREQTHESILENLIEECYEFASEARKQDFEHMYDELGDVLLQVVFHSEIGREHGEFDLLDVTSAITQKMMERHTHIFGTEQAKTSKDVLNNWERIKREQRGIKTHTEAMRNVAEGLPALMRAEKVQKKAAKIGFDFADAADALLKVHEEADEVSAELAAGKDPEKELGDLLFSIVNVCRLCGKNPEIALFFAVEKFILRFQGMENAINQAGKCIEDLTLSEMDVYWEAEKQARQHFEG